MASRAWGRVAGTVGQMLMHHALDQAQRREREQDRKSTADYRQQQLGLARRQADISELNTLMGPGETASPFTSGTAVPEGARTTTLGDRSWLIQPPAPKPETPSYTFRETDKGIVGFNPFDPTQTVETGYQPPLSQSQTRGPTPSEELSEKRFAVENALRYAESAIREPRPGGGPGVTFEELVPDLLRRFPTLTEAEAGGIASRANQTVGTERLTPVGQPVDRFGVGAAVGVAPPPPRPFERAAQQRDLLSMLLNRDRPAAGAPGAATTAAAPPARRLAGPRAVGGGANAPSPQGQGAIVRSPATVGPTPTGSPGQGAIAVPPGTARVTPSAGAPGPAEMISAQGLVRAARGQGMSDAAIRQNLANAGYSAAEIAELLGR
ncbi:MAG: hypothetical protein ACREM1_15515 [Longimicrobiales bacterium]